MYNLIEDEVALVPKLFLGSYCLNVLLTHKNPKRGYIDNMIANKFNTFYIGADSATEVDILRHNLQKGKFIRHKALLDERIIPVDISDLGVGKSFINKFAGLLNIFDFVDNVDDEFFDKVDRFETDSNPVRDNFEIFGHWRGATFKSVMLSLLSKADCDKIRDEPTAYNSRFGTIRGVFAEVGTNIPYGLDLLSILWSYSKNGGLPGPGEEGYDVDPPGPDDWWISREEFDAGYKNNWFNLRWIPEFYVARNEISDILILNSKLDTFMAQLLKFSGERIKLDLANEVMTCDPKGRQVVSSFPRRTSRKDFDCIFCSERAQNLEKHYNEHASEAVFRVCIPVTFNELDGPNDFFPTFNVIYEKLRKILKFYFPLQRNNQFDYIKSVYFKYVVTGNTFGLFRDVDYEEISNTKTFLAYNVSHLARIAGDKIKNCHGIIFHNNDPEDYFQGRNLCMFFLDVDVTFFEDSFISSFMGRSTEKQRRFSEDYLMELVKRIKEAKLDDTEMTRYLRSVQFRGRRFLEKFEEV